MNIGKALNTWKKQHGLTYTEIGRVAKRTRQAVHYWVEGETEPNIETLQLLENKWPGLMRLLSPKRP